MPTALKNRRLLKRGILSEKHSPFNTVHCISVKIIMVTDIPKIVCVLSQTQ
jgi:hypothetical protein